MEIDNRTEAEMNAITTPTPQYPYSPTAAFATTRAGAERRARAAATANHTSSPLRRLIDRLVSPRS